MTNEEVWERAVRWREHGDRQALDEVVKAFTPLVHRKVRKAKGVYDSSYDDAVQEGLLGLIRALEKWDPEKSSFITYAGYWIRSKVSRLALYDGLWVVMSNGARNLWQKIGRIQHDLMKRGISPTYQAVADETGLPLEIVHGVLRRNDPKFVVDIHGSAFGDNTRPYRYRLVDTIPDEAATPIDELVADAVSRPDLLVSVFRTFATVLTPAEQDVIEKRFMAAGDQPTLLELGEARGVTRQRIQQLQESALKKLRKSIDPNLLARVDAA